MHRVEVSMNSPALVNEHEPIGVCVEGCDDDTWLEVAGDCEGFKGKAALVVIGEDVGVDRDHAAPFSLSADVSTAPCHGSAPDGWTISNCADLESRNDRSCRCPCANAG